MVKVKEKARTSSTKGTLGRRPQSTKAQVQKQVRYKYNRTYPPTSEPSWQQIKCMLFDRLKICRDSYKDQREWLERNVPNYKKYKKQIINYITKFRSNKETIKDPNRNTYVAKLYEFKKSSMSKGAFDGDPGCTIVYEDDEVVIIPHTNIKPVTSSNTYNFKQPYNSKCNRAARARHFDEGIEYPSIFQGLKPEWIFQEIKVIPALEAMIIRHYCYLERTQINDLTKEMNTMKLNQEQLESNIRYLQNENENLINKYKLLQDLLEEKIRTSHQVEETLTQLQQEHSLCQDQTTKIESLESKQQITESLLFYQLQKITAAFTREEQPLLPWLFDPKCNIPKAHKLFNGELFYNPVQLAYLIAGQLLLARHTSTLEMHKDEIAEDLLLCLRQIYTGRSLIPDLHPEQSQDDHMQMEKLRPYLSELIIHHELIDIVKQEAEENQDENVRTLYKKIDQYLSVIANVKPTIENPFPRGIGTIQQSHRPIQQETFMNKQYTFHHRPLGKTVHDQLLMRLVKLEEEQLCFCGQMIEQYEDTYAVACQHVMHTQCFEQWISFNKKCYQCLRPIQPEPFSNAVRI